jgi:hypothetical protein
MVFKNFDLRFFTSLAFRLKMVEIETFNLNEDLKLNYDYDGLDDFKMGSFKEQGK